MKQQKSFREMIAETGIQATERLLYKAFLANRMAKFCPSYYHRRRLYQSKCDLLSRAIEITPDGFKVSEVDFERNVLTGICFRRHFRFHAPINMLSKKAREVIIEKSLLFLKQEAA